MDQGDVIIRPSSKGEDHLTVSWKVSIVPSFSFICIEKLDRFWIRILDPVLNLVGSSQMKQIRLTENKSLISDRGLRNRYLPTVFYK